MKTIIYILSFLFAVALCRAQDQAPVYRGLVYIKENKIEKQDNKLLIDLQIDISGLPVGRYQTLVLTPLVCQGNNSFAMQPIVINGANKQKMYERTLAFKGKAVANGDAYIVLKNDPLLLRQVAYNLVIPFADWMKGTKLVLKGQYKNYDGIPTLTLDNVLEEELKF